MHKWKEELRIEKNVGGMSWETCRKADYLDDDQGKDTHLLQIHDKIAAFKIKLQLWKTDLLINNEQCDSFPLLKSHLNSQSGNLSLRNTDECDMKTVICLHLDALISQFEK